MYKFPADLVHDRRNDRRFENLGFAASKAASRASEHLKWAKMFNADPE